MNKIYWFTGLPCSGKTTLATELKKYIPNSIMLNGDVVRSTLFGKQDFTEEGRKTHIKNVGKLAHFLYHKGYNIICSFISPYEETRQLVRNMFDEGDFIEIHLNTPVEECIKRDVKGMYKKALNGEIKDFTGVDAPYEPPTNPEFTLDTSTLDVVQCINRVMGLEIDRKVGTESQREYVNKLKDGFFTKYMSGKGLDVGYAGYVDGCNPILPSAIGVDLHYPGYIDNVLPFEDNSQDYVYSSHCLEHIADYKQSLKDWYRVMKIGGHMVITVPHQFTYEKRKDLPSKWNGDHKRYYTVGKLLGEIEESLEPNSYRIIIARDNTIPDFYKYPPSVHSDGPYEVEVILEKIAKPDWELE